MFSAAPSLPDSVTPAGSSSPDVGA
jgi:hypothetical protein